MDKNFNGFEPTVLPKEVDSALMEARLYETQKKPKGKKHKKLKKGNKKLKKQNQKLKKENKKFEKRLKQCEKALNTHLSKEPEVTRNEFAEVKSVLNNVACFITSYQAKELVECDDIAERRRMMKTLLAGGNFNEQYRLLP